MVIAQAEEHRWLAEQMYAWFEKHGGAVLRKFSHVPRDKRRTDGPASTATLTQSSKRRSAHGAADLCSVIDSPTQEQRLLQWREVLRALRPRDVALTADANIANLCGRLEAGDRDDDGNSEYGDDDNDHQEGVNSDRHRNDFQEDNLERPPAKRRRLTHTSDDVGEVMDTECPLLAIETLEVAPNATTLDIVTGNEVETGITYAAQCPTADPNQSGGAGLQNPHSFTTSNQGIHRPLPDAGCYRSTSQLSQVPSEPSSTAVVATSQGDPIADDQRTQSLQSIVSFSLIRCR